MGNTSFESEDWFSDEDKIFSLCAQNSTSKKSSVLSAQDGSSQQRNVQSATVALDGYGKAPRFVKKSCASQSVKNETGDGNVLLRNTFSASQPSRGSTRLKSPGTLRSSQDLNFPAFDSKDKKYWYVECKRQKALIIKLNKRLEQSSTIIKNISKEVELLSELLN